jgi:hypothetical protein
MSNHLDIHSQFQAARGLSPIVSSDDTLMVSETIDMQGLDGLEAIALFGVLADAGATFDFKLFHGDVANMSDEGVFIPEGDSLYGTYTQLDQATGDNAVQQLGYRGAKRYVRAKIVVAGNAGSAPMAIAFIKHLKKVGAV